MVKQVGTGEMFSNTSFDDPNEYISCISQAVSLLVELIFDLVWLQFIRDNNITDEESIFSSPNKFGCKNYFWIST